MVKAAGFDAGFITLAAIAAAAAIFYAVAMPETGDRSGTAAENGLNGRGSGFSATAFLFRRGVVLARTFPPLRREGRGGSGLEN